MDTLTLPQLPVSAPRDWNDEAARAVATYASPYGAGYALNVEPTDHGDYNPYSRTGKAQAIRAQLQAQIAESESGKLIRTYRGMPQRGFIAAVIEAWDGEADVLMAQEDFDNWKNHEFVYVVEVKDDGSILGFWAETSQFTLK